MSSKRKRYVYGPEFKSKVGLAAIRGVKTISELAQGFGVHPGQVSLWKKEILEGAQNLFEAKRDPIPITDERAPGWLYGEIGRIKLELNRLKESVRAGCAEKRESWIEPDGALPIVRQCDLAGVSRATVYAHWQRAAAKEL